jgi:hypothetical protein
MTMPILRIMLLIAFACALAPAAAGAAPRTLSIPVDVEGSVQVEFTASPGTPCERLCSSSGSLTWDPTGQANLEVTDSGTGARRQLEASLFFLGGPGQDAPTTTAHVVREVAGGLPAVCSDARVNDLTFLDFSAGSRSHVEARFVSGEPDDSNLFRTRCGGPLEGDLLAALPSARIDLATFTGGDATVDLTATRPFEAHGLTGTVRSSVKLKLGRFEPEPPPPGATSRPLPGYAPRSVIALYRVEQVAGTVETSFTGGSEQPVCNPLDSCGAFGTLRLSPNVSAGRATFAAYGPARRVSGRQLRAVLGLRPGPRLRGVAASGVADWSRDAGSLSESFTDSAGSACTDMVPLGRGFMTFGEGPRRVFASYGRSSAAGPDLLRTRCPGPSIIDAAQDHPLATGSVPRRAFRKSRVAITLSRGRTFTSEPYAGVTRPALTIVLRRVAVRERLGFDVLSEL